MEGAFCEINSGLHWNHKIRMVFFHPYTVCVSIAVLTHMKTILYFCKIKDEGNAIHG